MTARRIAWFWPVAFLAALGQLLLLLTRNEGGPAAARFALALFAFLLPGIGLGHLLTKPGTSLAARLPVTAALSVGGASLLLLPRAFGLGDGGHVAVAWAGLAVLFAFSRLVGGDRGSRGERAPRERSTAARRALWAGAIGLGLLHAWAGAPLSVREDAVDHVAAARAAGEGRLFAPLPWSEALGDPGHVAVRGAVHGILDLLARLSARPHHDVWNRLPAFIAPFLLLAFFAFGRSLFRRDGPAAALAATAVVLYTGGFSEPWLQGGLHPALLAVPLLWIAVGRFLEQVEDPSVGGAVVAGLTVYAVWAVHPGFGGGALVLLALASIRTFTSSARLEEGLPGLLTAWIAVLGLVGIDLAVRFLALGGVDPFHGPARGLLVWAPGRWTLDPLTFPRLWMPAALAGAAFLPVLFAGLFDRRGPVFSGSSLLLVLLLGFVPAGFPWVERVLGAHVHVLPWLVPLPALLVFQGRWALRGLMRSERFAWVRGLVLLVLTLLLGTALVHGVTGFAYTPGRLAAERAAPPAAWMDELVAARDTVGTARLVSDPVTARAAAAAGMDSWLDPDPAWDRSDALGRALAARALLDGSESGTPPGVGARLAPLPGARTLLPAGWLPPASGETTRDSTDLVLGNVVVHRFAGGETAPVPAAPPGRLDPRPRGAVAAPPVTGEVERDTLDAAAGSALRLPVRWYAPGTVNRYGPSLRVRLELVPIIPPRSRLPFRGAERVTGELPVAGGAPVHRWPAPLPYREELFFPLPGDLFPGTYLLRMRALAGAVPPDRVRAGALLLDEDETVAVVRVAAGTAGGL